MRLQTERINLPQLHSSGAPACIARDAQSAHRVRQGPWCACTSRWSWTRHPAATIRHSAASYRKGFWCAGIGRAARCVLWRGSSAIPFCAAFCLHAARLRTHSTGGAGVAAHLSGGQQNGARNGNRKKLHLVSVHGERHGASHCGISRGARRLRSNGLAGEHGLGFL